MRKNKRKLDSNELSTSTAFPTRMAKKRQVDLVKSHLPKRPAKKVAVVAALMESPTTKSGLKGKGLIPSAKNREAGVALSAMREMLLVSRKVNDLMTLEPLLRQLLASYVAIT